MAAPPRLPPNSSGHAANVQPHPVVPSTPPPGGPNAVVSGAGHGGLIRHFHGRLNSTGPFANALRPSPRTNSSTPPSNSVAKLPSTESSTPPPKPVAKLPLAEFGRAAVVGYASDHPQPIKLVSLYAILHRDGTDSDKASEPRPVTDQVGAGTPADMANTAKRKRQVSFPDGLDGHSKDFERPFAGKVLRLIKRHKDEFASRGLAEVAAHAAAVAEFQQDKDDPNRELLVFTDPDAGFRDNFNRLNGPGDDEEDQETWTEFYDQRPVNPFDPDGPREERSRPPPFEQRLKEALERKEDFGAMKKPGKDGTP